MALTADVHTPSFTVGDQLEVDFALARGDFSPDVGSLAVRDLAGELLGWVGVAGGLSQLELPNELDGVEEGAPICHDRTTGCGDWSAHDLEATIGGEQQTLPYGGSLPTGDLDLVHGGYEQQAGAGEGCPDWYVAHLALGLFPAP